MKHTIQISDAYDDANALTHTAPHHADEIFATAILSFLMPIRVFRSRDREKIAAFQGFVYDVGGVYEASQKRFDPRLLEDFESYVQIEAYRLQTARFSLERSSVPAFMGELSIKIEASDELAAIANLLLAFGRYAGVGIKTALGKGSLELNE